MKALNVKAVGTLWGLVDFAEIASGRAHIIGAKGSAWLLLLAKAGPMCGFQRMANISPQPGKTKRSVDDMIKKRGKKGNVIMGDGSFSIDQQRYNFSLAGRHLRNKER